MSSENLPMTQEPGTGTEALVKQDAPKKPIPWQTGNGVTCESFEDAWRFAVVVSKSGLAPKGMDDPYKLMVSLQLGAEIGLSPMAAIQNVAAINGRPGVYGDMLLGLVRASGQLEVFKEVEVGSRGSDSAGFTCTVKRRGYDEASDTFTVADAKTAGLWGKAGPWSQYPARMLRFRARNFLLRDQFADILKGVKAAEELADYIDVRATVTDSGSEAAASDSPTVAAVLGQVRENAAQAEAAKRDAAESQKPGYAREAPQATADPAEATRSTTETIAVADMVDALKTPYPMVLAFFKGFGRDSEYRVSRTLKELPNNVRSEIMADIEGWRQRISDFADTGGQELGGDGNGSGGRDAELGL